jgi:hypothetical protein
MATLKQCDATAALIKAAMAKAKAAGNRATELVIKLEAARKGGAL